MERAGPGGAAGGRGGASSRAGAGAREIRARFVALQEPARAGVTYKRAAEAFVASAVDAYACGCSGRGLRMELEGAAEELPLRGPLPPGATDPGDGLTELLIVWLALEHAQRFRRVRRWAPGPGGQGVEGQGAVDVAFRRDWDPFVRRIVEAYFVQRMAWFDQEALRVEQTRSRGFADPPSVASERCRLVFETLRHIAPQFPA